MSKTRSILLIALCLALVTALPVAAAPECVSGYTTGPNASAWGMGGTCSASYDDLVSQVTAQANANCAGVGYEIACNVQTVVTTACHWVSGYGEYVTDGYANHGCLFPGGGGGLPDPPDRP